MRVMRIQVGAALLLGLGLAGLPGLATGQQATMGQSPMGEEMHHGAPVYPKGPLKISFGEKSAEWTPEKIAALPHTTVTVYNEHAKANQTYTGVPLVDLLTPLGVPTKPHGKDFRLYLEVEGADGYVVVYAAAEATPDVHDATILVADALDGKPLTTTGPLQLVATGEKRPARWVRNLAAIRVLPAQ